MPNGTAEGPFPAGFSSFHACRSTGITGSPVPIWGCVRGQLEAILQQQGTTLGKPRRWQTTGLAGLRV